MNPENQNKMTDPVNENDKPYAFESFLKDVDSCVNDRGEDDPSEFTAETMYLDCIPEEERDLMFAAIDAYTTAFMKRAAPGLLVEFAIRQEGFREHQQTIKETVLQWINTTLSGAVEIFKQATPNFHQEMAERMMKAAEEKEDESDEEKEDKPKEEDEEVDSDLAEAIEISLSVAEQVESYASISDVSEQLFPKNPVYYTFGRTVWASFDKFCHEVNRPHEHVQRFITAELGTKAEISGNGRLFLHGKIDAGAVEDAWNLYKETYVNCPFSECKSTSTKLEKTGGVYLKECRECGVVVQVPKVAPLAK